MKQQTQVPQHIEDPAKVYNSNPFTLSFDALGRLFKTNVGWAIALIAVGFIAFLGNAASSVIDLVNLQQDTTPTSSTSFESSLSNTELSTGSDIDAGVVLLIVGVVLVFVVIAVIIGAIISTFLTGMFTYVMNQSEQGKSVSLSEAFNAVLKRFWRLLWATLLAHLKIFGWTLLFIVPGIIAALRYSLLPYLIMNEPEEEKGVTDAHDKVKSVVKGRLWEVFGVGTVATLIPIVGETIGIAGRSALYRQLQYSQDHKIERPKIHWLNYLGAILLGLLLFLAALIIVVIAIAIGLGGA